MIRTIHCAADYRDQHTNTFDAMRVGMFFHANRLTNDLVQVFDGQNVPHEQVSQEVHTAKTCRRSLPLKRLPVFDRLIGFLQRDRKALESIQANFQENSSESDLNAHLPRLVLIEQFNNHVGIYLAEALLGNSFGENGFGQKMKLLWLVDGD